MHLKVQILAWRRSGFGLCLAGVVLGLAVSSAAAQESDAVQAQRIAREQSVNRLLAAEVPLGSDAWRAQKLAQSHRRHEMAKLPAGGRTLQAFVVYPDTREKVPVVLMVPEDQGLNNWARDMADQIAAMGYVVIVPDVYSGYGPNGGGRDSFPDAKAALMVLPALMKEEILIADQNAWADYGKQLTQSNGKLAIVGFAWGGGRASWFATQRKDLTAAFVFYDWSPPAQALAGVTAPVYGFYAEDDTRVTKTLGATKAAMASAGKQYEQVIYPGSEHMFVRLGEEPGNSNPANVEARSQSLARLQALLKKL
jgi:carboxymethylenebutenolidase